MKEINEKMQEEMSKLLEKLEILDPSSEEYSVVLEDLERFNKLVGDNKNIVIDEQKAKNSKVLEYLKLGVSSASLVGTTVFYGIWLRRGFKFEETGSFTSKTFMNFISNIKGPR